jgi:hypothetical protein
MGALDDPTTRSVSGNFFSLRFLLPTRLDMSGIPPIVDQLADVNIVVPFVQTHMLWLAGGRLWPLNRYALQGFFHQSLVMRVGSTRRDAQGNAVTVRQQAALGAAFGAIGGVRACIFPPRAGLWSSLRPCSANPNRCLSSRRIPKAPSPTGVQKGLAGQASENSDATNFRSRTLAARLSTGSRSASHKKYRRARPATQALVCLLSCSYENSGGGIPFAQPVRRATETWNRLVDVPSVDSGKRASVLL